MKRREYRSTRTSRASESPAHIRRRSSSSGGSSEILKSLEETKEIASPSQTEEGATSRDCGGVLITASYCESPGHSANNGSKRRLTPVAGLSENYSKSAYGWKVFPLENATLFFVNTGTDSSFVSYYSTKVLPFRWTPQPNFEPGIRPLYPQKPCNTYSPVAS